MRLYGIVVNCFIGRQLVHHITMQSSLILEEEEEEEESYKEIYLNIHKSLKMLGG